MTAANPLAITTWNVISVRIRLDGVAALVDAHEPDVLCLQETKVVNGSFPLDAFEALGYVHSVINGIKGYNGVAILSKRPIDDLITRLPGDDDDEQARYIEAVIGDVRVASIYLPNGNPVDGPKLPYKLAWMDRLYAVSYTHLTLPTKRIV